MYRELFSDRELFTDRELRDARMHFGSAPCDTRTACGELRSLCFYCTVNSFLTVNSLLTMNSVRHGLPL